MPLLNDLFRKIRLEKAKKHIRDDAVVLDIGSGLDARMLFEVGTRIKKGIGLDYRTRKFGNRKIEVRKFVVKDKLPFKENSFDHVVMLAMIEHLKHPQKIMRECHRVLRIGGSVIITCPNPTADAILDMLLKLRLPFLFSDEEEASKHETCFTAPQLESLAKKIGFGKIEVERFELGLNTLLVAHKR
jgi:ubiquinone/menaquinone biosynthesis C-methylase UbiE